LTNYASSSCNWHMRRNKTKTSLNFLRLNYRFDRWIAAKIIAAAVILTALIYSGRALKKTDFFKVKEIIVRQGNNITQDDSGIFSYLKGRNIFELDLKRQARDIAKDYPSYKKIRLSRYLPDQILVDFLKRKPVACIKSYRFFYVDKDLVLFEMPQPDLVQGKLDLPQICGIDKKIFGAKYGARFDIPEMVLAMDIIKEKEANNGLKGYKIKRVDVPALNNASIFILAALEESDYTKGKIPKPSPELEIKIGEEGMAQKLGLLANLLSQVKNNPSNITYIDLRFKEPVIKFRGTKGKP
jgi:cell division septal protein FtsQ